MPTPSSCSTSPAKSGESAPTARTPGATGSRTSRWAPTSSSRRASTRRRSSSSWAPSARIRSSRPCRSARTTSGTGYPEETNAPYGVAKKAVLVGAQAYRAAVRARRDLPAPDEPLRPARQLRPRDLARDPGAHPEDGRGARTRSCSGATARRRASSSTSTTASRASSSPQSATTARIPSTSGAAREISIRELAELIADVTGYEGRIVWDTEKPNGQPRRSVDGSRARELFGFEARTPLREGIERTVAWYRSAVAGVGRR